MSRTIADLIDDLANQLEGCANSGEAVPPSIYSLIKEARNKADEERKFMAAVRSNDLIGALFPGYREKYEHIKRASQSDQ